MVQAGAGQSDSNCGVSGPGSSVCHWWRRGPLFGIYPWMGTHEHTRPATHCRGLDDSRRPMLGRQVPALTGEPVMRNNKSPVLLFDPCGVVDLTITPRAPRKTKLDGLRLGVLDNSKWNANKLLRGASAALGENIMFVAVNYYVKHNFSKDAAPELIKQIAQENDIVLTAIGDCGSCCSCCIRDAIELEKLGVPSAAIITTEFVRETELV